MHNVGPDTPILGQSSAIVRVRTLISQYAGSSIPVLVTGPTGSGKELVARAIHRLSGVSGRYVAVNVCALADSMFESALFGHAKGAFTGAINDVPGYLREADGGTLLLDEIGALPLRLQPKLLRVLESGTFRPLGAKRDVSSKFRIISATNDDLLSAGDESFRQDLLHRLRGASIDLPPLRDRLEDVAVLAGYFLQQCSAGAPAIEIAAQAMDLLTAYEWPGNIRQLRHTIEAARALAGESRIELQHVASVLGSDAETAIHNQERSLARQRMHALMEEAEWRTDLAAQMMGVHRSTVYRRLQRLALPIDRDAAKLRDLF